MRVLLDTHALVWWLLGEPALSLTARSTIDDPDSDAFVSAASAWEISIKYRQGKLSEAAAFIADFERVISNRGFLPLPISLSHGERAGALPPYHKDPFDRMLIAQAMAEKLTLVSNERVFDRYGVARLW